VLGPHGRLSTCGGLGWGWGAPLELSLRLAEVLGLCRPQVLGMLPLLRPLAGGRAEAVVAVVRPARLGGHRAAVEGVVEAARAAPGVGRARNWGLVNPDTRIPRLVTRWFSRFPGGRGGGQ